MRVQELDVVLDGDGRNILVKGCGRNLPDIGKITCPQDVAMVMEKVFGLPDKAEEHVYLVCMTTAGKPVGFFEVSHGTCSMAPVNPREVLVRCLLCGAAQAVLVHNHPGGDVSPSENDRAATARLREACSLVGIRLIDHIIVAKGAACYSFREEGQMGDGAAPAACGPARSRACPD